MNYAIVLAGGSGTRMGLDKPKQYIEIGGKPVIIHSLETFTGCDSISHVVVPCPKQWISYTEELLQNHLGRADKVTVVEGGSDRNGSIMNAIEYIESRFQVDEETIIVTHDGVRPFATEKMILDNIECVKEYGACGTAVPSTDTILETEDDEIVSIPDRSKLYNAQTPQSFRAREFRETVMSLTDQERSMLTDATKVYVFKGKPVKIVEGNVSNIKITYQHDLIMAEAILKARNSK